MSLRISALAGMIGAAVFALVVVALTQYGFMIRHGLIHGLAFLVLVLSLLLSLLFLWWRLRRDPLWRGYDLYTLITAILYLALFFLSTSQ